MAETTSSTTKKKLIPVLNNRQGNIQMQVGRGKDGSFRADKLLMLKVGANLVPEEQWKDALKQEHVKTLLATKIEATGAPEDAEARVGQFILVAGNPLNADNPLNDLDVEEALRFIANTESLDLLKELATQDADASVMQAINRKIKDIESPKNKPTSNREQPARS